MIDLRIHGLIGPLTPPRDLGGPGTIAQVLDRLLIDDPGRVILVGRSGRHTVAELDESTTRAAHALRALGVEPGTRVAASLPNDDAIVIAFLGAMKAGAIWVGLNRSLAGPEKAYMLADSQTAVFFGDPDMVEQVAGQRPTLADLRRVVTVAPGSDADEWSALLGGASTDPVGIDVDPLSPAAIAYTSGTTGFPKGAVHTQHNLLLPGTVSARRAIAAGAKPNSVLGVPLPLTILNLMILGPVAAYQSGTPVVAIDRVDGVGMAEWISREKVTTFAAVPAMVHALLTNPEITDEMLESIDSIGVGGADMPDAFRRLYEERFGRRVGTGYGLTEAPTSVTAEDVTQPAVLGSCGKALPHVAIHIVGDDDRELPVGEVGEVCIGPAAGGAFADIYRPMLGYWNRPAETLRALSRGLLHTGDIGCLDEDGNLFISDRKHDLIIRGGANVYPAEVERVLHDDANVAACAVIGQPDERLGERVIAFVQLAAGATPDVDALLERCRANLARYKVPDSITFVDGFDRTPMGKIRKSVLRELAS
jgi:acyl-CoA synthetase (AMP-forming)/AMP-acid ligase II